MSILDHLSGVQDRVFAEREDLRATVARLRRIARDLLRGWSEQDFLSLSERLYDPAAYSGGMIKIKKREYCALSELNRRVMASDPKAILYPIHAWVEGRGICCAYRAA